MDKLIIFGAGNIGRSFIGQVFGRNGYEVVFVDIDRKVIDSLNERGSYPVVIRQSGREDEVLHVQNVRGVLATEKDRVAGEVASAAFVATSVGKGALSAVMPVIAEGLRIRAEDSACPAYGKPLDIIIAENIREGRAFFHDALSRLLPESFPLDEKVGLVETSIGKMVPIMSQADREQDPLLVFAEAYNSLIVDKSGFLQPLPAVPELHPVSNITAYVDRKLFIHNLGHAAAAYLGYRRNPEYRFIWEALEDDETLGQVRTVMLQSADALRAAYPEVFTEQDLTGHIDDLLSRFQNRALGDTIYRVGRDLPRKLAKDDRILGAALLALRYEKPCGAILEVFSAGLSFRAADESGALFPRDAEFHEALREKGLEEVLVSVCGLDPEQPLEGELVRMILKRG